MCPKHVGVAGELGRVVQALDGLPLHVRAQVRVLHRHLESGVAEEFLDNLELSFAKIRRSRREPGPGSASGYRCGLDRWLVETIFRKRGLEITTVAGVGVI